MYYIASFVGAWSLLLFRAASEYLAYKIFLEQLVSFRTFQSYPTPQRITGRALFCKLGILKRLQKDTYFEIINGTISHSFFPINGYFLLRFPYSFPFQANFLGLKPSFYLT